MIANKKKFRHINLKIKRIFDVLGSALGILILSPILIIVSILIKVVMPGPILFKQERIGKDGAVFNILKFRSMKVDKLAEKTHDFSKDEVRLTSFGKLLRRTKIDEFPQLINVLTGDMSLVGPRPTVKEQVDRYTDYQRQRLNMRPGMTGLAQVNGNIALSWDERIQYDLEYINEFSIFLDMKILVKTIFVVVFGEQKFKSSQRK